MAKAKTRKAYGLHKETGTLYDLGDEADRIKPTA